MEAVCNDSLFSKGEGEKKIMEKEEEGIFSSSFFAVLSSSFWESKQLLRRSSLIIWGFLCWNFFITQIGSTFANISTCWRKLIWLELIFNACFLYLLFSRHLKLQIFYRVSNCLENRSDFNNVWICLGLAQN